jgi:GMP synthase-like glutamine amidotransferase
MLIGILETGRLPGTLDQTHGTYPDMFRDMLNRVADDLEFFTVAAIHGEIPDDPSLADGWLITGSRHGVYEKLDWILRLEQFVRDAVAAKIPLVGICFGHQVIASALGGRVIKSEKGWGVGHHDYEVVANRPWMSTTIDKLSINAVHQDQVVELPEGAEVIATSPFCENAVLAYGDAAFTIQAHPEFNDVFKRDLITERLEEIVPVDRMKSARDTLGGEMTTDLAATWIVDFFRHGHETTKKLTEVVSNPEVSATPA